MMVVDEPTYNWTVLNLWRETENLVKYSFRKLKESVHMPAIKIKSRKKLKIRSISELNNLFWLVHSKPSATSSNQK